MRLLVLTLLITSTQFAQAAAYSKGYEKYLNASPQDMQWWRDGRFGMFISWGPVSMVGTEIGWSRGAERKSVPGKGEIPAPVYDNLYRGFDPCKFNARQWMSYCKASGMKYIVFITKHCDGFCMWDTKTTDHNIMNSPFHRDVLAEVVKACRAQGIKVGLYYSMPDWYQPDYWGPNHARYLKLMKDQIRGLCTNYGKVDLMWFDRDHEDDKPEEYDTYNVFKMVRELQPGIIINNRGGLPGDYDTPEQQVGIFRNDRAWESCITIGTQWSWKPNDSVKSTKTCIRTLLGCAGGDGNLLLNFGPNPQGEIEPAQVTRMKEIGKWLTKYGGSVYGTRGGPFKPSPWLVSTHKGDTIYLHILDWNGEKPLKISPIEKKIVASSILTGGTVEVKQTSEGIEVQVPKSDRQDIDTIVALKLDGPASKIAPRIAIASGSAALGKKAVASATLPQDISVSSNDWHPGVSYAAKNAVDDDFSTLWAGDGAKAPVTLEVDLEKPTSVSSVLVSSTDSDYHWIVEFEVQYKDGDQWKTVARGEKPGYKWTASIAPVTARYWRLNVVKTSGNPAIREFQLFSAKN